MTVYHISPQTPDILIFQAKPTNVNHSNQYTPCPQTANLVALSFTIDITRMICPVFLQLFLQ